MFRAAGLFFAAEVVVIHFYAENDGRTDECDEVGGDQWPVERVAQASLHHEECRAQAHQEEGGEGYAVGVAGADGVDGLRQVAQYHTYSGQGAEDGEEIHSIGDYQVGVCWWQTGGPGSLGGLPPAYLGRSAQR